jgi:hypothetical protein
VGNDLVVRWLGDVSSLEEASLKARGAVDKSSKSIASFGGVAKVAAGAGILVLGAALDAGYKRWEEQQKVSAQTAAVLKSTGGAANVTAEQVEKLAKSIQDKTGVDKASVQSGENLLLMFTNVRNEAGKGNDIFNQATKATVDLSTRMGGDATTAAKMLGKALQDPLAGMTALRRAGVTFSADQKATIKALLDTAGAAKASAKEIDSDQKAVSAAQKALTSANERVTSAQLAAASAARAVTAAEDALAAASERVTAAKDGVTKATQHVSDARQHELDLVQKVKDAQTAEVDSIQRVKDAQTAEANAIQNVKDAQQHLLDVQQSEKDAEEALTQARIDATNTLIDLKNASVDASFSEQDAEIALQRAQENLAKVMADSTSTDLDKREAQLQVAEAQQHVTESQQQATDATNKANDAQQKGVDGSPQVIAAKKALHQAQELEAKANEEITLAQQRQAKSAEAVILAQQSQSRAAEAVIYAQQAQKKGARDIIDAQSALATAQRGVADAQLKATRAAQALVVSQQAAARASNNVTDAQGKASAAAATLTAAHKKLADAQERGKKATIDHSNLLKAQKIVLGQVTKEVGGAAEAAGNTFPGQLQKLKLHLLDLDEAVIKKLMPSLMKIFVWLNTEGPAAIAKLSDFWDAHGKAIMQVVDDLVQKVEIGFKLIIAIIETVDDLIHGRWSQLWDDLKSIFTLEFAAIKNTIKTQLDIVDAVFGGFTGKVEGKVNDIVGFFTKLPGRIADTVSSLTSTALDKVTGAFQTAKITVGGYIDDLVGFFKNLPGRIASTLKDLTGKAIQPFKDAFGGLGGALASIIKAPINAVIKAIDSIRIPAFSLSIDTHIPGVGKVGFDYGGSDAFFNIPMLDRGGYVEKTGLAVVHRGEEYLGTGAHRRSVGGGPPIVLNVNFNGSIAGDERRVAKKLVDAIHEALIAKQKRTGPLGFTS